MKPSMLAARAGSRFVSSRYSKTNRPQRMASRDPFCTYKKGPTLSHASASAADRLHDWLTLGRIVIDPILRCSGARMLVDFRETSSRHRAGSATRLRRRWRIRPEFPLSQTDSTTCQWVGIPGNSRDDTRIGPRRGIRGTYSSTRNETSRHHVGLGPGSVACPLALGARIRGCRSRQR
jgi:hypothetical protein